MKEYIVIIKFRTDLLDAEAIRKGFEYELRGFIKNEKNPNGSMDVEEVIQIIDKDWADATKIW